MNLNCYQQALREVFFSSARSVTLCGRLNSFGMTVIKSAALLVYKFAIIYKILITNGIPYLLASTYNSIFDPNYHHYRLTSMISKECIKVSDLTHYLPANVYHAGEQNIVVMKYHIGFSL